MAIKDFNGFKQNGDTFKCRDDRANNLGTASAKNSTSVVTDSSDLVESGAVKDIVGWGNKNILDTSHGILHAHTSDPTALRWGYEPVTLKAGTYTISFVKNTNYDLYWCFTDNWQNVDLIPAGTTVTLETDREVFIRSALQQTSPETDFLSMFSNVQLEKGSTATTYEPYHASVEEMFESLGGTLDCNQLEKNGNFANTSEWMTYNCQLTVSDNIGTVKCTDSGSGNIYNRAGTIPAVSDNKYLFFASIKGSDSSGAKIRFRAGNNSSEFSNNTTSWQKVSAILNAEIINIQYCQAECYAFSLNGIAQYKDINIINLTALFGSAIADKIYAMEQATAGSGIAYFRKYFPNDYYEYSTDDGILAEKADNSVIGTIEGANASKAWSVGEHFIKDGQFKEVTQPISSGGAINDSNTVNRPIADCLLKKKTVTAVSSASGSIEVDSNIIMVACAYCTTDSNIICLPFIYDNHTYVHLRNRNINGWDAITSGSVTIDIYYFD